MFARPRLMASGVDGGKIKMATTKSWISELILYARFELIN